MKLEEIEKVFEEARKDGDEFIGVAISAPSSPKPELIINPRENFDSKLGYYMTAYNENCELNSYSMISIIDIASGNTANEVINKLLRKNNILSLNEKINNNSKITIKDHETGEISFKEKIK